MNPDRWPEVERLYEKVMALPVDGRPAFLAEACVGDDALRREVEGLLNLETAATDFLEQPALRAAVNTLSRALPHLAPPSVPGYDIIRELGEGGMGVVYLAEQRTPLQRTVALKLIRPGMDSRQVLARFERERQALARMDHPNIAAVFDAGSTPDGRPYFVMEFVDGLPITEYCDRRNLSIRARLSLFIQICNAVQHAHQKGVIHRDLKPSNVLVIEQDGQAVPKVIDFGTAKSADPAGAQTTLTTEGLVFGTVAYMSPEQAAFSSDIDTTTDVYSLGVLLYELLVGCTPFDRHKVETAGLDAMLRAIRDSDPPRPSTLVTRDKDFRASIAARGTEVGLLAKQLSADLDWIVLKALEKDRRRRYSTAASLGADVQRFLDSKPIEARPPSVPYRIRKFTKRYRGPVAAIGSVAATLLLGLLASTLFYRQGQVEAERSREEAETQRAFADLQRKTADTAMRSALRSRADAESQREKVTAVLDSLRIANNELANRTAELAHNIYAATIVAADSEVRSEKLASARARLLAIDASRRNWEWWYLFNQTDDSVFKAVSELPHCSAPSLVAPVVSPDEGTQVLAVDAASGNIVLRRCAGVETWSASGTKDPMLQPPLTEDAADRLKRLRILTTQKVLAVDPGSKAMVVASLQPIPSRDSEWLIRVVGPQGIVQLGRFTEWPDCADIARDGQLVALGFRPPRSSSPDQSQRHSFEVWTIGVGRIHRFLPPRADGAVFRPSSCHVRFSPDGRLVASSSTTVDVWNTESGAALFRDTGHPGSYSQPVVFDRSRDRLAIGRLNGTIDLVELGKTAPPRLTLGDGRPQEPVEPIVGMSAVLGFLSRPKAVIAMGFSPDGSTLASAAGKAVTVWDIAERKGRVQAGHEAPVIGVAISKNGRVVYSVDTGGQLRGWPVNLSSVVTQSPPATPFALPMHVNDNGTVLAAGRLDGGLSIVGLSDLQRTEIRPGLGKITPDRVVRALALSRDGNRMFVVENGTSRTVRILSLPDGRLLNTEQVPSWDSGHCQHDAPGTDGLNNMALSLDDRHLAFSNSDCVMIVDALTLQRIASVQLQLPNLVGALLFRSDGVLTILTTDSALKRRPRIQAWDWRTNKILVTSYPQFEGASQPIQWALTQSADGQRIGLLSYGLGWSGTLHIFPRDLKKELARLAVGESSATALSPDGSRAVTVSREDPTVHIWDSSRSSLLLTLTDTESHLGGVSFTKSGQIIAGRSSGGVTIWDPRIPTPR